MKFIPFNANYWNRKVKDCVIRSFCMALNAGYMTMCKVFGKKFEYGWGYGLEQGISKEEIDEFVSKYGKKFDIKEIAPGKFRELQDQFQETEMSLEFIIDSGLFEGVLEEEGITANSFIGLVRTSRKEDNLDSWGFHAVSFGRSGEEWKYVDIPEKETTINAVPIAIYSVGMKIPNSAKISYQNEKNFVLAEQRKMQKSEMKNRQTDEKR